MKKSKEAETKRKFVYGAGFLESSLMYYFQIKVRVDLSNDWRNGLFVGFDSICDADSDSMSYLHLSIE